MSEREWQPIETYPRDHDPAADSYWGPNALLFVPTGTKAPASDYRIVTGRLEADMWLGWDDDGVMYDLRAPTYWMPLPLPPSAAPVPPDTCKHDGLPCYVSAGTDEAHWRCGTVQCAAPAPVSQDAEARAQIPMLTAEIAAAITAAEQAEREACAKIAKQSASDDPDEFLLANQIADAILARSAREEK